MLTAVSSLIHSNHPLVNTSNFEVDAISSMEVELFWALYNKWPEHFPRLERTKAATKRLWLRKRRHILPPRKAFETTVDYYEAALPLYQAKERFLKFYQIDNCFRSVQKALASIFPAKLF
jgi:hypothetical protein